MNNIQKFYFLLIFAVFSYNIANSQTFTERLSNNLDIYNSDKPTEKIYLHLDKTLYQQEDFIFYKVYLTEGLTNKLNPISNIAYVELLDPKGSVIDQNTMILENGTADNYFMLNYSYKGGLYKIRAYTNWQKNFENPAFFEKEIIIQKVVVPNILLKIDFDKENYGAGDEVISDLSVKNLRNEPIANHQVTGKIFLAGKMIEELNLTTNSEGKLDIKFQLPENLNTNDGIINVQLKYNEQTESITRAIPIILNKIDLTFYPEGGYIVAGAENKVAFEALNEFGLPADIEGVIMDENNKTIVNFASFHQGMGTFSFVPQKNTKYKAQITKPFKLDTLYILPKSLDTGFVLSYQNTSENKLIFEIFSDKNESAYLTATMRDNLKYSEKIDLKSGKNEISIPTKDFSDGIVRVTLFNNEGMPECERLVYFGKIVPMKIDIELKKDEFSKEELTELEIKTTYDDKPVSANLSMAIIDDKNITFADDKQDNIISWMLMSSEIKGKIYEPLFYFAPEEEKAEKALDYVLMTHGWRRFSWLEVLNEQPKIKLPAEKNRNVAGQVLKTKTGEGLQSDVWLLELDNMQRAAKLQTTEDGYFIFSNVDPSSRLQVVAKHKRKRTKNFTIIIFDKNTLPDIELFGNNLNNKEKFITQHIVEEEIENKIKTNNVENNNNSNTENENNVQNTETDIIENNNNNENKDENRNNYLNIFNNKKDKNESINGSTDFGNASNDLFMPEKANDNLRVDEVVVTAIGITRDQKKVGYSVSYVSDDPIALSGLSGKVSGVHITSASGAVGANSRIVLRGFSSYNSENPLIVLDGVPINNYSSSSLTDNSVMNICPNDLETITILNGPQATALYGSRAANGVIIISTKNNIKAYKYTSIERRKIYETLILEPTLQETRSNTMTAVYSSKEYWKNHNKNRERNATVYWNANIKTNEKGKAVVPIYCPDEVSSFKIMMEGISENGNVGVGTNNLNIVKPVNIQTKVPYELSYNDTMTIPVILNNSTKNDVSGTIKISHSENLKPLTETEKEVIIPANSSVKKLFSFEALPISGQEKIEIIFDSKNNSEKLEFNLTVYPKGFPVQKSFAGTDSVLKFSFDIDKPVANSINGQFNIYVDILADFESSLEGMFSKPWGCFEQVSSCTYPNILALNYMENNNISNPELTRMALGYIKDGYQKIAGYETKLHGFEWYGNTPPHEVLTAYGLLELIEMKKVYQEVDDKLIDRSKTWLMSRKDGKGNFKQHQGKYAFSSTPQDVANAYIVYAMARAGLTDFEKEYEHAKAEALKSKDPYRLGLLTNAAFYMNKTEDFKSLLQNLKDVYEDKDFENITAEASITYSWGNSLKIEITSIYLLALLKETVKDLPKIEEAKSFILSKRSGGYFGNTQGTIMALTALIEYNKFYKASQNDVKMQITVNENTFEKSIPYKDLRAFSLDLNEYITEKGKQDVEIEFLSGEVPYSFDFEWNSLNFIPDEECKVNVETNLENKVAKVGDNVRMNVIIENKTDTGIPMTTTEIGIPAGLSLQPWQLKKMTEENAWDYYEIFNGKLVIYYVAMGPNEKRHLKFDLKADIAGNYTSRASSSYLYYTNEFKDWEDGMNIKIMED